MESPWTVTLDEHWGAGSTLDLQIPNPVSFMVQKLLIHGLRCGGKKSQDILYIHDTLELFAGRMEELGSLWPEHLQPTLHANDVRRMLQLIDSIFGTITDHIRDAAAIPQDRQLDPARMQAMCHVALGGILR